MSEAARTDLPELTPARRAATPNGSPRIPLVMHRCLTRLGDVPADFREACHDAWLRLCPELEMRWTDYATCRAQLAASDDPRLVRAWDKLIPGSYRADLWRCFALREHGGIYADAPVTPFRSILEVLAACRLAPRHQFVIPRGWAPLSDGGRATRRRFRSLLSGFIAVTPQHPFIVAALERLVHNVLHEHYGDHQTTPTGPVMLAYAIHEALALPGVPEDHWRVGYNDHGELSFFVLDDLCDEADVSNNRLIVLPDSDQPVMASRYDLERSRELRREQADGQPRYYELWRRRQVYRP